MAVAGEFQAVVFDLAVTECNSVYTIMFAADSVSQLPATFILQIVLGYIIAKAGVFIASMGLGQIRIPVVGLICAAGRNRRGGECGQSNTKGNILCPVAVSVVIIVITTMWTIIVVRLYPAPFYLAAERIAATSMFYLAINPESVTTYAICKSISEVAYAISVANNLFAFIDGLVMFICLGDRASQHANTRSQYDYPMFQSGILAI